MGGSDLFAGRREESRGCGFRGFIAKPGRDSTVRVRSDVHAVVSLAETVRASASSAERKASVA